MALSLTPQQILDKGEYYLLVAGPHWERLPLGEIADVQNGAAFKSEFFTHDRGLPLIRIRDVGKAETDNHYDGPYDEDYLVYPGDVIIGMDGDFKTAIWSGEVGLLNQRVCRLKVRSDLIDRNFLFYCLQPYLDAINAETSSVTVKHLSSRTVAQIPLPVPPYNEQRRIVAKIEELFSELDKGVESLNTAHAQLKTYRQSLLKAAFEGRLTKQWRRDNADNLETADQLLQRIRNEREARYRQQLDDWKAAVEKWGCEGKTETKPRKPRKPNEPSRDTIHQLSWLPDLPDTWRWAELGWMTLRVEYGTSAKSKMSGDVPVVRMGNLQNGRVNWDDLVFSSDRMEIDTYLLETGDVLFNRTNSPELVGKSAIYFGDREAIFAGYLIRINHFKDLVDSRYLTYFLNSKTALDYGALVKTDGVNQSNINGQKLTCYPFPYCSFSEQQEIGSCLNERISRIEELEKTINVGIRRTDSLRQSILKCAFEGKLVPQDSNDEPASALLERIRAEQEKAPKSRRRQQKVDA